MKVLIVGAGKLGNTLSEYMILEGIDVTLMDINTEVLERTNEYMDVLTVNGNGIDISTLKDIDIDSYDLLIATTGIDETNMVICTLAKKLGCKKVISRIRNIEYIEQLELIKKEMDIDNIINEDLDTAKAIERYLLKNYNFYSEEFANGKIEMIDFNIRHNKQLIEKKIVDLSGFENLLIAAISRDGETIIPNGQTKLMSNDTVYIVGKNEDIKNLDNYFKFNIFNKGINNVMILGGSNIAYYLAKRLVKKKIFVKIIEQDKNRAEELSKKLEDVLIIHGDGSDIHLLEEEMLDSMDTFVGTTGFDEQNLLMALVAKQSGVKKSIAKISRKNYIKIIDRLEIDAALNPTYIVSSNILKLIRGKRIISTSLLLDGDAEVTEMIVDKDSSFINIPLEKLKLPKGIIIGAICRNNEIIIPKGNTELRSNDRIIIFCLSKDLSILKGFHSPDKGGRLNGLWNRIKGNRDTFNN
ncbi:MAG TPA: Trk system potassium transporter TrkA [Tissierellaceae bacterium]|nr:Trk system potassium transporter TrkA [Tissierellaceae bacterium]